MRGLSCFLGFWADSLTYIAYLDEFGHIGPYVSREHPSYHDSPVFGLAGFVLPSSEVRGFRTLILLEAIKRIDDFCGNDCTPPDNFLLFLNEHEQRPALLTEATRSMYRTIERRRRLIEPPFNIESHRYHTVQAADWIAGLVGRLAAVWAAPNGGLPKIRGQLSESGQLQTSR